MLVGNRRGDARSKKVLVYLLSLVLLFSVVIVPGMFSFADYPAEGEVKALAVADVPQITKQPAANQTFAKGATARLYLSASSSDGGYLTYKWYRSGKISDTSAPLPTSGTPVGDTAVLQDTTPGVAGYYYYWAEITNNLEGSTPTTIKSDYTLTKVVDRTLPSALGNGKFEDFRYNDASFPWKQSSAAYDSAAFSVGWVVSPYASNNVLVQSYWDTTAYYGTAGTNIEGKRIDIQYGTQANLFSPGSQPNDGTTLKYAVELSGQTKSSIFQEIATVPGKIYEWSLYHGISDTDADTLAIVIGAGINESTDYKTGSSTNRYTQIAQADSRITNLTPNRKVGGYTFAYGIGGENTLFVDVLKQACIDNGGGSGATDYQTFFADKNGQTFPTTYNGDKYYVAIKRSTEKSSADPTFGRRPGKMTKASGVYTVPEGQGTTVFGFVDVTGNGSNGNALANITFASGTSTDIEAEFTYTGEASIPVETKSNYAYTIAELRGSTIVALPSITASVGSGSLNLGLGGGRWYTGYADGETLTFSNLTPSKTYRVIGIPVSAISADFGVNLSANGVLDDGYYKDIQIQAASESDDSHISNTSVSYQSDGTAWIEVQNTNSSLEYALLAEQGNSGKPNTAGPANSGTDWTAGGGELVFKGLPTAADKKYYLIARPSGYTEVTYASAAPYEIVVPAAGSAAGTDLTADKVTRSAEGTEISVKDSLSNYTYAVYNPADGAILETKAGNGGELTFDATLSASTTYQVIQKLTSGGIYLAGVRVYPYPKHLNADSVLSIDYVAQTAKSTAASGYVANGLEYDITPAAQTTGSANPGDWTQTTGTSQIVLSDADVAAAGNVILRASATDGYSGAKVQPEQVVSFNAAPAAPVEGTDYVVDYAAETVTVPNTGFSYERFDAGGNAKISDIVSGVYPFALTTPEWTGNEVDVNVRKAASQADGRFASLLKDFKVKARKTAPALTVSLNAPSITVNWDATEYAGETIEYKRKDQSDSAWTSVVTSAGTHSFSATYTPGTTADYQVRIKAKAGTALTGEPSSYIATISSPLFLDSINFGSLTYGYDASVSNATKDIKITNIDTNSASVKGITLNLDSTNPAGIDAFSLVGSLPSESSPLTIQPATSDTTYKIKVNSNLPAGIYKATIVVSYGDSGATTSTTVNLTVAKDDWDIDASKFANRAVTEDSIALNGISITGTHSAGTPKLSWTGIPGYDNSTPAADTAKTFTGLSVATIYNIGVQALGDDNHNASAIIPLTAYTAYATPNIADIIEIDYAQEKVYFKASVTAANYTIKLVSPDTTLANAATLSDYAKTGDFQLTVTRNASGNYPASLPSNALTVTGKADGSALGTISTTKASNTSLSDGTISVQTGPFQYRVHSTADETSGWTDVSGSSVNVMANTTVGYDVRVPSTLAIFGSISQNVKVEVKKNQTLSVDDPSSLVYATGNPTKQLTYTGSEVAGGSVTYKKTDGDDSIATVSSSGVLTINGAGTIKVTVTKTGDADFNETTSPARSITISEAPQATVTMTPSTKSYGDGPFNLSASGGSGSGAYEYQLATNAAGNAGTLSGNQITITKAGSINVQARRAASGNYTVSEWSTPVAITVNPKELTVINETIKNKAYDGTTTASLNTAELSGIVGSDDVSLDSYGVTYAFASAAVDNGKTVTRTGNFALSGTKKDNYTLAQPAGTLTANITDGFTAVVDTHYTKTTSNWSADNFVVTAASGYKVSKTNTATGTWTDSVSWNGEATTGSAEFYVKRVDGAAAGIAQGEISKKETVSYNIDRTAPNLAEINYEGKGLKGFLNTITFGRFFKVSGDDPVDVVIVGSDTSGAGQSGVAKVEYFASTTDYTAQQAADIASGTTAVTWVNQASTALTINYNQRGKYHIFAKVTDNAGNFKVFYDSVAIYAESAADTSAVAYTRKSNADKPVAVTLNDNTIKAVRLTSPATATLNLNTDYTVSGSTITLKKEYLENLKAVSPGPTYTYAVDYYPQGVTGAASDSDPNYSETPTSTTFTVTVSKANQATLTVVPPATLTYGDSGKALSYNGGSGLGDVGYEVVSGPASVDSSTGVLTVTGDGAVVVKASRAGDDDYNAAESATVSITVGKAEVTGFVNPVSVVAGKGGTFTQAQLDEYGDVAKAAATLKTVYPDVTASYAGGTASVPVSAWVFTGGTPNNTYGTGEYDAGEYTFTAMLGTIPSSLENTGNFTATVTVIVNDINYGITLGQSGTYSLGSAAYGYTASTYEHAVSITNFGTSATGTGGLKATLTGSNATSFALTPADGILSSIAMGGSSTALKVTPNSNLSVGTYTATLTVDDNGGANSELIAKSYDVTFEVTKAEITGFVAIGDVDGGSLPSPTHANAAAVSSALGSSNGTVTANYAGGITSVLVSAWVDTDGYDATTPGSYTFTATLGTIPSNFANTGAYTTSVEVVVLPADAVAPTINAQPAAKEYYDDQTAADSLSVGFSNPGTGALSYQWYKTSTNDNTSGGEISGATGATYTPLISGIGADTFYYYVVITATQLGARTPTATVKSTQAKIEVTVRPVPALSSGSASRTSVTAATIGFTTSQPGTAYYLEAASDPGVTAIITANHSLGTVSGTVTDKPVTLSGEGEKHIYVVVVGTTTAATKYGNVLEITADKFDTIRPTISTIFPTGTGVAVSGQITITFSESMDTSAGTVNLSGGSGSASAYAVTNWTDDKTYVVSYSGLANSTAYTIGFTGFEDTAANTLTSGVARTFTTRGANAAEPNISASPLDADYLTTDPPASVMPLTVTANIPGGTGTLSYQWYYNATDSNTVAGATPVGSNSNSYKPEITAAASVRYYFVEVTNTITDVTADETTAKGVSLTAKVTVTVPQYTVKFDIGSLPGITGTAPADMPADINTSVNLPDDTTGAGFALPYHTFGGWSYTPSPSPNQTDFTIGNLNNKTWTTPGTIPLYAVWVPNVALIFDSEGGSSVNPAYIDPAYTTYGQIPEWSGSIPTKTGNEFAGWYIEKVDGNPVSPALVTDASLIADAGAAESVELHARWIDKVALKDELAEAETKLPNVHKDNYEDAVHKAYVDAINAAKVVDGNPGAAQVEVDAAFDALRIAQDNLKHYHPVVVHSHASGLKAFGQAVSIEIKGDIRDVIGLLINGVDYPLTSGAAANTYNITEKGKVVGSITEGSAIVTLPVAFADRLANGTHTVEVSFRDAAAAGSGKAEILVNRQAVNDGPNSVAPNSSKTGDDMNLTLWLVICGVALIMPLGGAIYVIRRRRREG